MLDVGATTSDGPLPRLAPEPHPLEYQRSVEPLPPLAVRVVESPAQIVVLVAVADVGAVVEDTTVMRPFSS